MNTNTRFNHAKKLYRQHNYVDCERLYRELFYEDRDAFDRNDNVFFLRCINEVGIKNNFSSIDLDQQGQFVLDNFTQEDCANRNFDDPYAEIFINMGKIYNQKHNYYNAIKWIWKVDKDMLTTRTPRTNSKAFGYSQKEKWYSYIIESLMRLEKFDGALVLINEALDVLPDSKSDAKLWFTYKLAKIHIELGNHEESLAILNDFIKIKKESFVYLSMAKNHYALGNHDEALSYAIKAALTNRSVQNNLGTYTLISNLLDKKGMKEESVKHCYLVYTFKKANGHRISEDLGKIIKEAGLDMGNTNYKKIQKELIPLWSELKYENAVRYSGTIKKVFEEKGIGFIKNDFDSNDTFFSFKEFKDSEDFIYPGTKVSFYVEPTFDKSKGRESTKAVEIEVIY